MKANFYPKYLFTFFLIVFVSRFFAQDKTLDSLKLALKTASHDTVRCNILSELCEVAPNGEWEKYNEQLLELTENKLKTCPEKSPVFKVLKKHYAIALNNIGYSATQNSDLTKALTYFLKSLKEQEKYGEKPDIASALLNIGTIYQTQGNIPEAIDYFEKSFQIRKELDDKKGMAKCMNNLAIIYDDQGDVPKSIEYHSKSLKIFEESGDKKNLANSLCNIGLIYNYQGETKKSLDYFARAMKIQEEIGEKKGMAFTLNNIGFAHEKYGDIPKALEYYNKSLKIREEIGDKKGMANPLNNIGVIYTKRGDYTKALEFLIRSLQIREDIGDKRGMSFSLSNIGDVYFKQKNYPKALEYLSRSLKIGQELGFPENIRNASINLSEVYKANGNYQKALESYELYIQMRDSINNQETRKASLKQQFKYEYDKKAAADSVAHAKETEIKNVELQKQQAEIKAKRYTQYALFGGLALVIIFAGFIFNRFKITQKQKEIIDRQKHVVEEAHKEIIDSINYAERLQRSLMASDQLLNNNIGNYFVYFNPKEAVSGDFYWASVLNNGNFCLVAADSTGHGVPGAIMSMMNMNSLKESVKENLTEPQEILNKTRNIIIETLANDGSMEGGKDGMDAALIVFDSHKTKVEFSLANNPLWLIRKGELIEYKPDKMPVGKHDRQHVPFSKQEIVLEKDDLIYILTDGYADQFGGERGKKFMYKPLKELLLSVQNKTMSEQKKALHKRFEEWKKDMEQVDDVCIIGIRL